MEISFCADLCVQENTQMTRNIFNAICAKMFCKSMNVKFVQFYKLLGIYIYH